MGEANENRNKSSSSSTSSSRAMESLSLEINRYPRDLLQRFMAGESTQQYNKTTGRSGEGGGGGETEEVELNLGLSLGGRFGVDKNSLKLARSSSIAGSIPSLRDHHDASLSTPPAGSHPHLMRTSSLPTESEEEWRKRKEMQCLRRMEAKRRRSEKQKNSRGELNLEEVKLNRGGWVPSWANKQSTVGNRSNNLPQQQGSQGSVESQGGSSSGLSELESKPVQGSSSGGEPRSPASNQSLQEQSNQEAVGSSGTKKTENKKLDSAENKGREIGMNAMEDMPCVFTKGDGPNGRRVDGILYKYGKGEEVRIMCVCHGIFLSPAEFVKHAGGGDVNHPLRHIVVNPSGPSL